MEKYSYFNTTAQVRDTWERLCPPNEFRRRPPSALSGLLPAGLLAKADSVFMVASGSLQGTIVWMANVHRADQQASGVDQEPFGIVFHGPTPALSGVLIHHGNWPGLQRQRSFGRRLQRAEWETACRSPRCRTNQPGLFRS